MKRVWTWFKIIVISLLVFIFVMLLFVKFVYNPLEISAPKRLAYFEENNTPVSINDIVTPNGTLQTVITNNHFNSDNSILVCFIHGAPGSGMDFKKYMIDSNLLSHARLMIVDRPGYGNSDNFQENISNQANDIFIAIQKTTKYKKLILVGHSYGCAVVAKIAINNPKVISKVVFLAAVIDPFDEKVFWYTRLFNFSILNWFLPTGFQTAVYEKMYHKEHLIELHNNWKNMVTPLLMVHGKKDTYLAPLNNVTYAKDNIPIDKFLLQVEDEMGHLIPFLNQELTRDIILESILEFENK